MRAGLGLVLVGEAAPLGQGRGRWGMPCRWGRGEGNGVADFVGAGAREVGEAAPLGQWRGRWGRACCWGRGEGGGEGRGKYGF